MDVAALVEGVEVRVEVVVLVHLGFGLARLPPTPKAAVRTTPADLAVVALVPMVGHEMAVPHDDQPVDRAIDARPYVPIDHGQRFGVEALARCRRAGPAFCGPRHLLGLCADTGKRYRGDEGGRNDRGSPCGSGKRAHQPWVPGSPLKGPTSSDVIQPP